MKSKKKIIIYLSVLLLLAIIFIIILLFVDKKNIVKFILSIDYTALTAIVTLLALIYTIVSDRAEKNKTIESFVKVSNQIEFENTIYECLTKYDDLMKEMACSVFDYTSSDRYFISIDSITKFQDIAFSYTFIFNSMKSKIFFFYKNYKYNHPCFDDFISNIDLLNSMLIDDLKKCNSIVLLAFEVNREALNGKSEKLDTMNNSLGDKRKQVLIDMESKINKYLPILYETAQKCIQERANFK